MHIEHLGHSCLLITVAQTRIVLDPGAFSDQWHDLRDLDAILITHQHPDHMDPDHLPQLVANNPQAIVCAPSDAAVTADMSALNIRIVAAGEELKIGDLMVKTVGGEHACIHADIPLIENIGYVIAAAGSPRLFHPGDSLTALPEGIDILALPLMGPWAAMKEHVEFIRALGSPATSIPIHDELLSDRGRELLSRQLQNLTETEIISLRGTGSRSFGSEVSD